MVANKEKEMEETGAALRRIPNGANLRANKKTVTILKDKCIDLIRALDEKENQIAQLCEAVVCMGNTKDQVALNLAHRCDELEHLLQPLKALSNDASSSITLARELRDERAKNEDMKEQLRQAQSTLKLRDEEITRAHALVDEFQVRLKVAIEFHEADSRDLHKQIDALSTSTTGNTPWETSSETSSVTSGFSSREHHMDIEGSCCNSKRVRSIV